jgi:hypothetical protein
MTPLTGLGERLVTPDECEPVRSVGRMPGPGEAAPGG